MRPLVSYRPPRGFENMHHHWDASAKAWMVHLLPGEYYVTTSEEFVTTVLGSCVSTCIHDPVVGIGGMNHFMLPEDPSADQAGNALRYGGFAVERLINELLKQGAVRGRLECKVFGGGQVIAGTSDIGKSNVDFVRVYLADEGLPIVAEDVGGQVARRVRYHARSGRVFLKQLPMHESKVREREQAFRAQLRNGPKAGGIELF
jgi:chemotaxis protein CheD